MILKNLFICAAVASTGMLLPASPSFAQDTGAQNNGKVLFETHCASCHGVANDEEGNIKERVAPPIFGVKDHYLGQYADREAFTKAVANWTLTPNEENTLMRGAIKNFGLMPAVEISEDEAKIIAQFIFDEDFSKPEWYADHKNKEHGGWWHSIKSWFSGK